MEKHFDGSQFSGMNCSIVAILCIRQQNTSDHDGQHKISPFKQSILSECTHL